MQYLMVFLGGGAGSICRYLIGNFLSHYKSVYPLGTFAANIISCIILGLLISLNMKGTLSAPYRLMLMTGFCGGFSTFSTFSSETFLLFQGGHYGYAFLNIGLSVVVCLFCIYIGIKLGGG